MVLWEGAGLSSGDPAIGLPLNADMPGKPRRVCQTKKRALTVGGARKGSMGAACKASAGKELAQQGHMASVAIEAREGTEGAARLVKRVCALDAGVAIDGGATGQGTGDSASQEAPVDTAKRDSLSLPQASEEAPVYKRCVQFKLNPAAVPPGQLPKYKITNAVTLRCVGLQAVLK
ncbi:hypothetical protein NDU88_000932 [Pleurodeles waltl]|uniref:Uncharacterized protein n=1 Tax=Pleurodeles waltl TaxID=8319 RepID=A0AAV7TG72_PLEWA|nr:hypothetical protein NDU88_000932 [Pleurodeles waltl]